MARIATIGHCVIGMRRISSARRGHGKETGEAVAQPPFKDMIRAQQQRRRDGEAKHRGGLEVDEQETRRLVGRPRYQDESAYLLTGFARCSVCGRPIGTDVEIKTPLGAEKARKTALPQESERLAQLAVVAPDRCPAAPGSTPDRHR